MVVHMMGQMADMAPILRLASEFGLLVIEDAAQVHGASYLDADTCQVWPAGGAGDLAGSSLSDVKNIGSMGQDAVLLRAWRNTCRTTSHRYTHEAWGIRARMDEYAALAGKVIAEPHVALGREHAYFTYMVSAPTVEARLEFERKMCAEGIEVANTYADVPDQRPYRTGQLPCRIEDHEVSRSLTHLLTAIPLYHELEEWQIQLIEDVLADAP
jgi:dTDP-4-amino-4,6-dideoxygalactose transaminase